MQNAISTRELTCHFGPMKAVQNLTIDVPHGSIFAFLGENGAGKTTTIRLLLGLRKPTGGTATVLGYDSNKEGEKIRFHTGALMEDPGLYQRLSARENLEFFARIWRLKGKEKARRIKEILIHMGLWERSHEQVDTWSRGMKQKLAIARVLLHSPSLIFMDEPTAGLDPVAAAALREDISQLAAREGVTIFLTTHNIEEAERLSHKMAIIRQGRLVAMDEPERLKKAAHQPLFFLRGEGFTREILHQVKGDKRVCTVARIEGGIQLQLQQGVEISSLLPLFLEEGVNLREVIQEKSSLEEAVLGFMKGDGPD